VDANGNVGIGTSSPSQKLNVYNSGSSTIVLLGNSNSGSGGYTSLQLGTSADVNGYTYLQSIKASGSAYGDIILNQSGGNVGIGTTNPGSYKLAVEGKIGAREVNVIATNPWPDYVFEKNYTLPTLESIKTYIDQNKHLPEVPSATEVEKNGVNLGEMNALLLKKIEELTLYVIELKKRDEAQQKEIEILKNKNR